MKKVLSILLVLAMIMVPVNTIKCMAVENEVVISSTPKAEESKSSKVLNAVKEHAGNILAIAAATGVAWSVRNVYENYKRMLGIAKDPHLSLIFKIKMLGKMLFMGAYEKEQILKEINSNLKDTIKKYDERISKSNDEKEDPKAKELKDEKKILNSYENVVKTSLDVINAEKAEAKASKEEDTAKENVEVAEENVKTAKESVSASNKALEEAVAIKTKNSEILEGAKTTYEAAVNTTKAARENQTIAITSHKELLKGKNITIVENLFI